ncbi:hypothetical protein M409DRAFT_16411 [Zasmidium cellare ATCC 36951]|uniref:RRM domain-containing protein n=1 Tax=Zasmidium cellare ATCC 36951 TaxID=1080233 RepID=A0A6A6D7C7_ZASCE|nr:uncharacterized protein M409DRAFT_16411 [Zasmidium cellare ATCC 36951]KAF2174142.1 hypothetical protein M409DRAFT_16411 [Zasmidium cellare ATCC 36951]
MSAGFDLKMLERDVQEKRQQCADTRSGRGKTGQEDNVRTSAADKDFGHAWELEDHLQILDKPSAADEPRDRRSRSPRRRYEDRGRSRSPSRDYRRERRDRSPPENGNYDSSDRRAPPRSHEDRQQNKEQMMKSVNESSQQDRRVYVGNLSYDVKWHHLKDHMRKGKLGHFPQYGTLDVLFADVLLLPNGMSKGCGIVEYATRDQAQTAITSLSNTPLMGRLVYVREDRETEPRFSGSSAPTRGGAGGGPGFGGGYGGGRGGYGGGGYGGGMGGGPPGGAGGARQIFVSNLPFQVGWQDLKDLFRQAGNVLRADVHVAPDGHPKGSGIVAFETPEDAQNAIQNFHGYDWQGRILEVREDRYAGSGPGFGGRGGFGGGYGRGGFGGGGYGGRGGGFGGRGGFGGGYGGGRGGFGGGYGGGGNYAGGQGGGSFGAGGSATASVVPPNAFTDGVLSGGEPGPAIHVKNLPWSTSNEDLVELFQTIGNVDRAEIQYEPNGRSRGSGVVQFSAQGDAQTAIEKFQGYSYGGRPLGLDYAKYPDGGAMEGQEPTGNIQEQMM